MNALATSPPVPTRVPFRGGEIIAIAGDNPDTTLVVVAPIAASLGLDWSAQFRRLKRNPVLKEGLAIMAIPSAGGPQDSICLPLNRLSFWLATISADRIADADTRAKVILYQKEAADALHRHFFGKVVAQPASPAAVPDVRDPVARRLLIESLVRVDELESEVGRLSIANAAMAPKANALDRMAGSSGSLCPTDAAKGLKVRPTDLFTFLRNNGWIYKRSSGGHYLGYQGKVDAGLLEHRVTVLNRADGSRKTVEQVLITPKGLARLSEILSQGGAALPGIFVGREVGRPALPGGTMGGTGHG